MLENINPRKFKHEDVVDLLDSLAANALLSLIGVGFEDDLQWIKAKLAWADAEEVEYAYQLIKKMGLIQKDELGNYIPVDFNFSEYLDQDSQADAAYLLTNQLTRLIKNNPQIINSFHTGSYLWTEEIYHKVATGISYLIEQANLEAKHSPNKDMLVSLSFMMTETSRVVKKKGN